MIIPINAQVNPNEHHPTNELSLMDSRVMSTLWCFSPTTTTTKSPTVDAKGILDLQAGASLLTENRCHTQDILKGEHIIVGEHFADSVSKRVDLQGRRKRSEEACRDQVHASLALTYLSQAQQIPLGHRPPLSVCPIHFHLPGLLSPSCSVARSWLF